MSALDPKTHLRDFALRAKGLLTNDLNAITEEKRGESPGAAARNALHIVAECAAVNSMVTKLLSGEPFQRPSPEERDAFFRSFDTAAKALAFLEETTGQLLKAYENLDESTLGDLADSPLGRPMTRFGIAELAAMHMMYHDGQLNYI